MLKLAEHKSNFTILDTDDQKKLIRNIVKAEDLDAKKFSPQLIMFTSINGRIKVFKRC